MSNKDIEYYMKLNYTYKFRFIANDPSYPEGYYYGGFEELQGCKTDGKTVEEFLTDLEVVKRMWIEVKLEYGEPIPEPEN
ncbi:type II toxin-antitoxin system HicB family antitoxin [Paenibacillus sp. 5J-6]|jgi:predicted RNase H-like HicB family nuclease|uniref:Type II toxin-antitoxin system HicB family antitoxin n=1 Tax=Paenibacillus silvestris TaxID=2606219 RepID=A0A6L8VDK6_9BACL|nr:type II toxin-antitoxin system HicB family antitoxin [Paenibacillus silvestris]MZQ87409.1 type II toxin-antitoxin system HicB family antitoxin [Paenibacillus silvestris]